MWTQAKEKADPIAVAADYVEAAYEFADRTFGAVDLKVLRDFAAAAHKVAASVESGTTNSSTATSNTTCRRIRCTPPIWAAS